MTDPQPAGETAALHGDGEHSQPHMPPNSGIPVLLALSLGITFVGFLSEVRGTVGPAMWLAGLLGVIACCGLWIKAARREYLELPEDGEH